MERCEREREHRSRACPKIFQRRRDLPPEVSSLVEVPTDRAVSKEVANRRGESARGGEGGRGGEGNRGRERGPPRERRRSTGKRGSVERERYRRGAEGGEGEGAREDAAVRCLFLVSRPLFTLPCVRSLRVTGAWRGLDEFICASADYQIQKRGGSMSFEPPGSVPGPLEYTCGSRLSKGEER